MTEKTTRADRQVWKQAQETLLANPEFVSLHILPLLRGQAGSALPAEWAFEMVRNKVSNRMTVRYSFGSTCEIYGKAYHDASLASDTHQVMARLWDQGFSSESILNIPEPLGIVSAANLFLMRRATGTPLSELVFTGGLDDALEGARLAARWLAKFQTTAVPGVRSESPCERLEILKLADAVAKVAAELPEHSALLIEMLHGLRSIAPSGNSLAPNALMHGQFRPAHVFLRDGQATVIDVEKICLSDPAKDVARFCHVLKKTCLEQFGDIERAEHVAAEFVGEYQKHSAAGLKNFSYFRALLAMKAFAKMLKNRKVEERDRQVMSRTYCEDFERAVNQCATRSIAA